MARDGKETLYLRIPSEMKEALGDLLRLHLIARTGIEDMTGLATELLRKGMEVERAKLNGRGGLKRGVRK